METAPGRTAAQKMGIREGTVVGLIDPPVDYLKVLGELPEGAVMEEDSRRGVPDHDMVCTRSGRVRGGIAVAADAGRAQPVVDRLAEGEARRTKWEFRAGARALGDGASGLQDLFMSARRSLERNGVHGEEGAALVIVGRLKLGFGQYQNRPPLHRRQAIYFLRSRQPGNGSSARLALPIESEDLWVTQRIVHRLHGGVRFTRSTARKQRVATTEPAYQWVHIDNVPFDSNFDAFASSVAFAIRGLVIYRSDGGKLCPRFGSCLGGLGGDS